MTLTPAEVAALVKRLMIAADGAIDPDDDLFRDAAAALLALQADVNGYVAAFGHYFKPSWDKGPEVCLHCGFGKDDPVHDPFPDAALAASEKEPK
jgi:hypothetical protein